MADDLTHEVKALRDELRKLNDHRFMRIHDSLWATMLNALARGLMMGLGTVIGATVLLSVVVWALSQIEFIPIIGEWAREISAIVESSPDP